MPNPVLSNRLTAVARMVKNKGILADVGCDHGYLPICLVQEGRIRGAVAMDVRKGPLSRAEENVAACGLEDVISLRLSDGLEKLQPLEADSVSICGMGGMLMVRILSAGLDKLKDSTELILEPQSEVDDVRLFLVDQGYTIDLEDMILEDGKFYPVIHAIKREGRQELTDLETAFGPVLLREKNQVLKQFLDWQSGINEQILDKLSKAGTENASKRAEEVKEEQRLIKAALEAYEM